MLKMLKRGNRIDERDEERFRFSITTRHETRQMKAGFFDI
jgi:hypothetical protein